MNKIILPLTFNEYYKLFRYAQYIHSLREEPIPELRYDNEHKIKNALELPFQTFDGQYLYNGLCKKATMLFYLIIDNHVMGNGNKRMACLALSYFLAKNFYDLTIPDKQLRAIAKKVANPHNHEQMLAEIEKAIRKHLKPMKKAEALVYKKKKRIKTKKR